MTNTAIIENLTEWAEKNICSKMELKLPNDSKNGVEYSEKTVHPAAFPLFVPAKDRLPPKVKAPIPSLCAQIKEGSDSFPEKKRTIQCRFAIAAWNPGEHSAEKLSVDRKAPASPAEYKRNMEGWRDLWNFVDFTLEALENTEFIAGLRLKKENGIRFGPYTEENVIWDYYPYWYGWIDFELECGVVTRVPESYEEYL